MTRVYCWEPGCDGNAGFGIAFTRPTQTEPSQPLSDTCPKCGGEVFSDPPPWNDIVGALLDDMRDSGLLNPPDDLWDYDAIAWAIDAELKRQARARRAAERSTL